MSVCKAFPVFDLAGSQHIASPAAMSIIDSLGSTTNALYEAILNQPSPGSSTLDIRAHDHVESGCVIPVGPIFVADWGEDYIEVFNDSANTWRSWDLSFSDSTKRIPTLTPFYIPPTMVSNTPGNGPDGRVRLKMFLDCLASGGQEVDIRVVTTREDGSGGVFSDVTTVTSATYTLMTTEIETIVPYGGWNNFYLETRVPNVTHSLRIRALMLVATDEDSMPDSSGLYFYPTLSTL